LIACSSASQEARYIAEQVLALRDDGVALANMAVLFRSSAHSQTLEFELMKRDIPTSIAADKSFLSAHT
jgi:DNA helicase-2/ATP-dependent DNA helicase PcrA